MKTLDSTFKLEKNKQTNQPIFLYTIYNYDGGGNNLYYAEYDADVVYNSITYTKFPITHEYISESSSGEVEQVKVKVSNVNRLIEAYLELYDFRGKKVDIMMVWANQLGDTDAFVRETYYIDNQSANQEIVVFSLSTKFDVIDFMLPGRKYSRNYCSWKFKGIQCGYSGAETTCNKTKQDCSTNKNNLSRFGGFPSIDSRQVNL